MPSDPVSTIPAEHARRSHMAPAQSPEQARGLAMPATPASMRRLRRRWMMAFGAAILSVLAIGLIWQPGRRSYSSVQPLVTSHTTSTPSIARRAITGATADTDIEDHEPEPSPQAVTFPAPQQSRHAAAAMHAMQSPRSQPGSAAAAAIPPTEPAIPSSKPGPIPPEAPAPAVDAAPRPAEIPTNDQSLAILPAKPASASTGTLDRLQASTTSADTSDEPGTDVPPATMDSPQVRDAWLARIRDLAAAGDRDAARTSLHEFRRRYPDHPLPDDLRTLPR